MTTAPYSPATATAIAFGATDQGYVETDGIVPWDPAVSRYNLQEIEQRLSRLLLDQRDNTDQLREQLLGTPTRTVKIMAAGDSITVGFGSTDGLGWRGALASQLTRRRYQPVISTHAHGGWTRPEMAAGLPAALAANRPDIVLINIGTNDWVPDDSAQAAYQTAYGLMLDQILASSSTVRVACALIPISQVAAIQGSERRVNAAIRAAVAARTNTGRVLLSDHTTTTQARWATDATDATQPPPGRATLDGVHPLDAAYLLMALAWLATIEAWLAALAAKVL